MEIPAEEAESGSADRSFAAGDVVLTCEPWVCSLTYQYRKQYCAYCFRLSPPINKISTDIKMKMCSCCRIHHYCGIECQIADWKKDHQRECKMLKEMNYNIQNLNLNVEEDYNGEFDFCTAEILVAKIVNKIKSGRKEQLAGFHGKLTAQAILELLPYDPYYDKTYNQSDHHLHALIWPTATLGSIPECFDQLVRKVYYNAFPMRDPAAKAALSGAGLFPRALHRQMTPVCWDINVTMDLQRRTLVVRATQDIVSYAGLQDLRQNELSEGIYASTLSERRASVEILYSRPCTCSKCTPEYDAEINPLKCLTTGCTACIPSDRRALQPCSQCGAINDQRLRQLKDLMNRNSANHVAVKDAVASSELEYGLLLELDQANIVHLDAHFRYVLGSSVFHFLVIKNRAEEAWNLCPGIVACVRAFYPKYHLGRAAVLRTAGELPCVWYSRIGKKKIQPKWKAFLDAKVLDWLWEARDIYRKVAGPGNQWELEQTRSLRVILMITSDVAPEHMDQGIADLLRLHNSASSGSIDDVLGYF